MFDSLSPLVRSILNAILIGTGGFLVAFLVSKLSSLLLSRMTGKAWGRFIGNLLALGIVIGTLTWMLNVAGAAAVVVILATALTGALSLGSENIASDLVTGVKLFATRLFQIGDNVSIADQEGEVLEITLTYIVLLNEDGDRIIIRNSDVVAGTIINYSKRTEHKIEVQISIPVSQDLEKVTAAILEGLKGFSTITEDTHKPGVICETVSEGRMNLLVYAFITDQPDYNAEKTRLMVATLRALKQNNIDLSD
ncbi:MAG: mechanosensitive ion channel [Anaerolineales bacterium]|jgi:small-conductance mechanosensitive channel|uniref:mechanosensitive ion channel family protein n=1 Tax=Candidatus Villigracilis vicinus TaxID=3140679 RepID=UPI0031353532|nr:mechanosensitive ion channel [Anaerolineales bacterium]MBK9780417.1 mechanosensitive ion channel [Anaerolineales bacterium]